MKWHETVDIMSQNLISICHSAKKLLKNFLYARELISILDIKCVSPEVVSTRNLGKPSAKECDV